MKALEDENGTLKRLLADAMLDNTAMEDFLSENNLEGRRQTWAVAHLRENFQMSERRVCSVLAVGRKKIRYFTANGQ